MQYYSLTSKVAKAPVTFGYNQDIVNRAPEFQATQTYTIKQGYVHEDNQIADNRQNIPYQSAMAQQTAAPLDVRDSKCPTQGNCAVCHRLCMMRK